MVVAKAPVEAAVEPTLGIGVSAELVVTFRV